MRGANITTAVAVALWFGWALLGRDLIGGVASQQVQGFPNVRQIDSAIVWPLWVVVALLTIAWVCNWLLRWEGALALISAAAILALLPYLAMNGGGVRKSAFHPLWTLEAKLENKKELSFRSPAQDSRSPAVGPWKLAREEGKPVAPATPRSVTQRHRAPARPPAPRACSWPG
jgi:hypothetical protein